MLAPAPGAALEVGPVRPLLLSPLEPSAVCHWMPNSAALSALTSTIRLSTSTWARRPSSLSITARNCRYCGSGAVMMRALVVGSAWICPPVEGWLLPLELPVPMPVAAPPVKPLLAGAGAVLGLLAAGAEVAPPVDWLVPAAMAARSVAASLVASAFFRYTTWMLPLAALLPAAD